MQPIGTFDFTAPLWLWPGNAAWHFVTLPPEVGADVRDLTAGLRRGFGSVRVEVSLGGTTWRTSVFPDSNSNSFVLPVKKAVRVANDLQVGAEVQLRISLLDL